MTVELIEVTTTCDSKSLAQQIAVQLVERRLAACVQISGPVESHYRWHGQVETSQEWKCVCKTTPLHYDQVQATIEELHPYDVPEIIAVEVFKASAAYLAWANGELGAGT